MIIAHILNDDGGVGRVVETLCNAQTSDGNKVYVVTSNGKQKFFENLDPKVELMLLSRNTKLPPILNGLRINYVYQQLRKKHPSEIIVLHAHNLVSVGLFARLKNIPIICTIHGLSKFPNAKETLRTKLQTASLGIIIRKILSSGGKVFGVSQHTSKYYAEVSGKHISTIYNGTAESTLTRSTEKGVFTVVHIGDISRAKGWDSSFKAFSILKQRLPEKVICFVSAGRLCDINEEKIRMLVSENSLSENEVQYLGFVKSLDEIYSNADALVLASDSEGLPMTILEAQSAGIPVIATPVGGCPEIIEHGVNGFIVKKDPAEIADRLEELALDQDMCLRFCQKAKQIHKERFSSKVMIEKYYQAYEAIGEKCGNR